MNVTDDVLNDLLTLYLAGEASADTPGPHRGAGPARAGVRGEADRRTRRSIRTAARAIDAARRAGRRRRATSSCGTCSSGRRHAIFLPRTLFFAVGPSSVTLRPAVPIHG